MNKMKLNEWRLIKLETYNGFMNMAIDEAILIARIKNLVPNTIRFYRWNPSAVSIGRFQNIHNEVNIDACEKNGIDIVRRITGGGAVYHDYNGEITYSIVFNTNDLNIYDNSKIYNIICNCLIEAIKMLGINADFDPGDYKNCPNITINKRKISGSAQFYKNNVILQHGTFLINVDLEKMFTFLKVFPNKNFKDIISIAKRKITSLREELGFEIQFEEVYEKLIKGFEKVLNIKLNEDLLSSFEKEISEKLYREKYSTKEWNFECKSSLDI
ncbi:MAG: biotin/lipoate A/B protein ligase family protein [Nitrososphaerota archaeon]